VNQHEAMKLLLSNRVLFKETLCSIEDKSRKVVPYRLNPIQLDMNLTSTGKDIYVKPAQVGFTSDKILDYLIDCVTIPGTTAVIISYDEFITGRLLRKAHSFHAMLQDKIPSIDRLVHKSTNEMTFEKLRSSFFINSARSFAGVRGETIHRLLLDEFAFWQPGDAEKIMASAVQRAPLVEGVTVDIGSTANGMDNVFYETYMSAKEGKAVGSSVFKAHFYPWFVLPEYSMRPDSPFTLPGDDTAVLGNLTPDEQSLVVKLIAFGVPESEIHSKLRWRRYKVAEVNSLSRSGGMTRFFQQEYPEDDVSCFIAAGDMVHPPDQITDMAKNCYPAPIHHLFADIWSPPEKGLKYLVSVDPGEGKTSESVATVWTFTDTDFTHHATLSGFYENEEMASKTTALAQYYNGAVIANEDALGFTVHIKKYPYLYYRTDLISGRMSNLIGWQTNGKTKPYMIQEINRHLPKIRTHDIRIISQCRNIRWVQGARGDRAVSVGADDYYMSMGIGIVCKETLPVEVGLVGTSGWSEDWGK